jgi:predicted PurR-regulated permease PerM
LESTSVKNYFFYFASLVLIVAGIKAAAEIVIILFLAIFIASIISTFINFLEQKHIPKIIAYLFVLGGFVLLTILLGYVLNISLKDFISNLPQYEKQLQALVVKGVSFAETYGYEIDKNTILDALNLNSFFGITTNLIGSIGTFLSKFLLIIIGIAFILAEAKSFEKN